jgi:hypothetical protein
MWETYQNCVLDYSAAHLSVLCLMFSIAAGVSWRHGAGLARVRDAGRGGQH